MQINQLNILKANLEELEKRVNSHNRHSKDSIENSKKDLQEKIENLKTQIQTLQQEVLQKVTANQTKIDTLESSLAKVAKTGDYNDLKNLPTPLCYTTDHAYVATVQYLYSSQLFTNKFYFACVPDLPLQMDFEIFYTTNETEEIECTTDLLIDDQIVSSTTFGIVRDNVLRKVVKMSCLYYPTKQVHGISFNHTYTSSKTFGFYGFKLKMSGHNPLMLYRDCRYYINSYKTKFYITQSNFEENSSNAKKYILPIEDLTFTYDKVKTIGILEHGAFSRNIVFNIDQTITEDTDTSFMFVGKAQSQLFYCFQTGSESLVLERYKEVILPTLSTFKDLPPEVRKSPDHYYTAPCCCFIANYIPSFMTQKYQTQKLTLNGVELLPEWTENVGVWQPILDGENYFPFRGCMCQRYDGYYYYFPQINSTYCVKLGYGRNGKLFKRLGSETLYAYIGGLNRVTQYVLEKDEEDKYFVSKETTVYGISEYNETFCDTAIVVSGNEIAFVNKMFD